MAPTIATPQLALIHHDSPFGRWEMARALPAPALRAYIRAYEGYTEEVTNFAQRLEVPSRDVALIINFGPAFAVAGPGELTTPVAYDSFVAGLHDSHALVAATGPSDCLQVDFTPLGAHQFFGVSMAELTSRTVALTDLLGPAADRLVEQLRDAPSWEARFALLDTLIAARLAAAPPPCDRLTWAWEQMHAAHGRIRHRRARRRDWLEQPAPDRAVPRRLRPAAKDPGPRPPFRPRRAPPATPRRRAKLGRPR